MNGAVESRGPVRAITPAAAWRLGAVQFLAVAALATASLVLVDDRIAVGLSLIVTGIALGAACSLIAADPLSEGWLNLVPVLATTLITVGVVALDLFFASLYFLVAIFVAFVFARIRAMAPHLALLAAAPFLALLSSGDSSSSELGFAVSFAPVLVLISLVVGRLTEGLERSRQDFKALSGQDALTGVGNYRSLLARLSQEVARHRRREREFALLVLDLDDFKAVNETQGHLVGDLMLAVVGSLLDLEVRAEDTVFRQGGDEFSVVAPETDQAQAEDLCSRLEDALAGISASGVSVSATVGFAIFPRDGKAPAELIDAADVNLFARRRAQRNPSPGTLPEGESSPLFRPRKVFPPRPPI